ncbi:MAG: hypothetical protein EZS28_019674, partial [Streblomastix strix]
MKFSNGKDILKSIGLKPIEDLNDNQNINVDKQDEILKKTQENEKEQQQQDQNQQIFNKSKPDTSKHYHKSKSPINQLSPKVSSSQQSIQLQSSPSLTYSPSPQTDSDSHHIILTFPIPFPYVTEDGISKFHEMAHQFFSQKDKKIKSKKIDDNLKDQKNSSYLKKDNKEEQDDKDAIRALVVEWLHMQNPLEEWEGSSIIGDINSERQSLNEKKEKKSNSTPSPKMQSNSQQSQLQSQSTSLLSNAPNKRARLPGQLYPGLGVGHQISLMLGQMASDLNCDCIINMPEHFHNAYIYKTYFRFINPMFEAFFQTLLSDLLPDIRKYGLATVAYCVSMGLVLDSCYDRPDLNAMCQEVSGDNIDNKRRL